MNNYKEDKFSIKGDHILDNSGKPFITIHGSTKKEVKDGLSFVLTALNKARTTLPSTPKPAPFPVGTIIECTDRHEYLGAAHPTKGRNTPVFQLGVQLQIVKVIPPTKTYHGQSVIAWMDGVVPKNSFSGKPFSLNVSNKKGFKKVGTISK